MGGGRARTRVYPVGRLDYNTEGLLLLTNDGEMAHALMHPSGEIEKTYQVKLRGNNAQWDFQRVVKVGRIGMENGA